MRREERRRRPDGFTVVELLLVVAIIGILVQIALPNYRNVKMRAVAVEAMAAVDVVEQAARDYQADNLAWPPEAGPGSVPAGLEPHLPSGFSFVGPSYRLDWEVYDTPGGVPGLPGTRRILAVGIIPDDEALGETLVQVFGQKRWFTVGPSYIWIVERE